MRERERVCPKTAHQGPRIPILPLFLSDHSDRKLFLYKPALDQLLPRHFAAWRNPWLRIQVSSCEAIMPLALPAPERL